MPSLGTVAFAVGTGRCGTTFLSRALGLEPRIAASHERLRLAATFHMYCMWHGIDVDPEGFLIDREAAVADDLGTHDVSFEASALLSHSIAVLHERFNARFVWLVRNPAATVASFAVRGWFERPIPWGNSNLPPSYREGEEPRHFLGRNLPRGEGWARFRALPPIGRLGWFWQARNQAICDQLAGLPPSHRLVQRLEDLDYPAYQRIVAFLGLDATLDPASFEALAAERINSGPNPPSPLDSWSTDDVTSYEAEVAPLANAIGYTFRVDALRAGTHPCHEPLPPFETIRARLHPSG
ncbi:MAG: hypothetical protein AAGA48_30850 [Myxococcota bacterium]